MGIHTCIILLFLVSNVFSLSISIVDSRSESTLIHLYIVPTESCYLWCSSLPYGAPAPSVTFLKNMNQYHLEATTNEVILDNLIPQTDYSVYCYAETIASPGVAMTNSIEETRVDISTITENDFHVSFSSSADDSTTIFPIVVVISFSQPVSSLTTSHLIVENAIITSLSQKSTTSFEVSLTPQSPGEISLSLFESVQSTSGNFLYSSPVFSCTYKGASISSPSILAYSHYALVSVTSNKPVVLYVVHYEKSLALTPSSSVITSSGLQMTASQSQVYSANITNLQPETSYVIYITGKEEFGPVIATPITDTRTTFTTVKQGDKPSEGKQCPKGWNLNDGLLLYSQCSGHGICIDHQCKCYSPYTGDGCSLVVGKDVTSANSTHHLIHTAFTLQGIEYHEDYDQDVFLQTSLQLAASSAFGIDTSHVQIRLWEKQEGELSSKLLRGLDSQPLKRAGILPYLANSKESPSSLYIYITTLAPVKEIESLFEQMKIFLSSNSIFKLFEPFNLGFEDLKVNSLFIQESSDPYTCYNNRLDGDETDVDCGGTKCSTRCLSKQACTVKADCDGDMNCFNKKCLGLNWTRVFYVAGISVAVIVVIILISVVAFVLKKRKSQVTPSNPPPHIIHATNRRTSFSKRHHPHIHHFIVSLTNNTTTTYLFLLLGESSLTPIAW